MDSWLVNGVAGDTIKLDDRGFSYGDGLFETIAVRNGACRFLDNHLQRLEEGCSRLRIPFREHGMLRTEVTQLAAAVANGAAKLIVTRGRGPRGYRLPDVCMPTRIVGVQETQPVACPAAGVALRYCETPITRNPALAGLKTLNRLEQVLARAEWSDTDIAEGLMLNDRQEVVCGTMTNVFFVRDGMLYTPQLSESGVNGIMRQQVLAVAGEKGIDVREVAVSKSELSQADEIFLTNALIGLWPVSQLDCQSFGRGPTSAAICAGLAARGVTECAAL